MAIDYSPLFQRLKEKGITTYNLINNYGISKGILDNLKHNRNVTIYTLEAFCMILDCQLSDLAIITKDEK